MHLIQDYRQRLSPFKNLGTITMPSYVIETLRTHAHAINRDFFFTCKTEKKKKKKKMLEVFFFYIFAQNKDCGYTLEPPGRGGTNEYPQSMF